jgi:hypothetical protein
MAMENYNNQMVQFMKGFGIMMFHMDMAEIYLLKERLMKVNWTMGYHKEKENKLMRRV